MNTMINRLALVFTLIGSMTLMTDCASTGSLSGLAQAVPSYAPMLGPKAASAINRTIGYARPAIRQMEQAEAAQQANADREARAAQEAQAARQEQEAIDAMTPRQRAEYLAAKQPSEAAKNQLLEVFVERVFEGMMNGGGGSGSGGCPAGYQQEGNQCVTYRQVGGGASSPAPAPAPVAPIHPNYASCHSQMGC